MFIVAQFIRSSHRIGRMRIIVLTEPQNAAKFCIREIILSLSRTTFPFEKYVTARDLENWKLREVKKIHRNKKITLLS